MNINETVELLKISFANRNGFPIQPIAVAGRQSGYSEFDTVHRDHLSDIEAQYTSDQFAELRQMEHALRVSYASRSVSQDNEER